MSKLLNVLKRTALAAAIFAGYSLVYNQIDTGMIKALSQKKSEAIVGVDFEAYKQKEPVGISILRKGDTPKDLEGKTVQNWSYLVSTEVTEFMRKTYSNAISFTPYCSDFEDEVRLQKDIKEKKDEKTLRQEKINRLYEKNEDIIKDLLGSVKSPDTLIFRIKGNDTYYQTLNEPEPINFVVKKIVKNVSDKEKTVIIDLEAPDNGDYKAHNERIRYIKSINPKLRVATTLDKNEGYDEQTGTWSPEKTKKYWENADIIILEDYCSNPGGLEKSIKMFKQATKGGKQIIVRVVTGAKRINDRGIKTLEAELEEYQKIMETVHIYADGCLANDWNGAWLYSTEAYDKKERLDTTKMLYKKFRRIKIDNSR
ncbi:hypothetical protein FJZ53_00010 [Candidatus Woesearchaeota archaeon]|nr:hypothetical protein [Candidatus Woesearchaeota archaeon]